MNAIKRIVIGENLIYMLHGAEASRLVAICAVV